MFSLSLVLVLGTPAFGEIDLLSNIIFLDTGIIHSDDNQFQISNDMNTREFSNGKIIRVSGQTIEGFPYITYSKILEDKVNTHGIIFIGGKFVKLSFIEESTQDTIVEKEDDLQILVQYTQRVYSKQYASIEIKTYDPQQNKLKDFNLNYGFLKNIDIKVTVLDENDKEFHSSAGITNDKGFFETEFYIPERYPQRTLTVTVSAEDDNSKSSKILQMYTIGTIPDNDSSP
ncbi:MAG: hypothetical protein EA443_00280 [Nitrosopumilus sp.]|nr:MAG: hypothetical protein EA443_00280 [Nitrosopumilus sp.]